MTTDSELNRILRFDALDSAEQITGLSYKEDDLTQSLGFAMMTRNSAVRNAALMERDDTVLINDLDRYIGIIEKAGFERVYEEPFVNKRYGESIPETLFVYARRDGFLLVFDTYSAHEPHVNSGKLYYNWVRGESRGYHSVTSSGRFYEHPEGDFWSGDHDCREALLFNIDRLLAHGTILPVWRERAFGWITNFIDHDINTEKYGDRWPFRYLDEVTEERVAKLPEWVQTMIGPKRE
jgi:hypothetical protein